MSEHTQIYLHVAADGTESVTLESCPFCREIEPSLIAAAPGLLAAAQAALAVLTVIAVESNAGTPEQASTRVAAKRLLRAAIAKAERGEE